MQKRFNPLAKVFTKKKARTWKPSQDKENKKPSYIKLFVIEQIGLIYFTASVMALKVHREVP